MDRRNSSRNADGAARAPREARAKDRGARPPSQRQLRVGEELRHALSEIFARGDLRDPDLMGRSITVTEVRAAPDLRNVTAYVVPLGGSADEALLAALARSAPFLRARLAETVQLRYAPKLFFAVDKAFDAARRIEEVLREPEVARDLAKKPEDE